MTKEEFKICQKFYSDIVDLFDDPTMMDTDIPESMHNFREMCIQYLIKEKE
jgi:hypothetical protein